ncbi:hypothetical protein C8R44DRAFT_886072 [Mycena epipterygia]|nr:hypothetical protein C8R44DRAFT_886072 [Mycena epipterygia]
MTIAVEPPSPVKRHRAAVAKAAAWLPTQDDAPIEQSVYPMGMDPGGTPALTTTMNGRPCLARGKKRIDSSPQYDPALHQFRSQRNDVLGIFLRRNGCLGMDPEDCFGDDLLCATCCVDRHAENPLHRIERWDGQFFRKSSLKEIGLCVQLGHSVHERCLEARAVNTEFIVLHTNGIHDVAVDICDCKNVHLTGVPEVQMLHAGWFPATVDNPKTCTTFACLDYFMVQTPQAKTTMYDYYSALEKLTDNTGLKPPNRYHAFLRMCREFLYILFLALNACFRLKRRLVSSEIKDPPLTTGWAYLTERVPYREYLLMVTDQKEMSTCSGLATLDHANTKFSWGYSTTGVGMGVCMRHEFVQPNGVGDLQKGERYANMDYIFASILRHLDARLLKIISYDIVCQWWKNLMECFKQLPPLVRLVTAMHLMCFVIPKMHIHSHTLACQLLFSLNLVPGSTQTDGKGIKHPWANIGGIATSTREMGPGSREDVLNCHWSHWNWQKLLGIADRLRKRTDRVQEEYTSQLKSFTTFSMQQGDRVPAWRTIVEEFERDGKKKNPYEIPFRGESNDREEEKERVARGVPGIHEVSPSEFIRAGLEVEGQQRWVRAQVKLKKAGTTSQQIDVAALRRKLGQSITRLRHLQAMYTPASIVAVGQRTAPLEEQAENVPLFLPSALRAEQQAVAPLKGLAIIEDDLRDAQCAMLLVRLRAQLHIKSRLLTYKELQSRHQGTNMRARALVETNETKIRLHSEKYQMAWEAKRRLGGGNPDLVGWRMIRVEDIRCMADAEELAQSAEKRRAQTERQLEHEAQMHADGAAAVTAGRAGKGRGTGHEGWRERAGSVVNLDSGRNGGLRCRAGRG